jgi:hypothetical protein
MDADNRGDESALIGWVPRPLIDVCEAGEA